MTKSRSIKLSEPQAKEMCPPGYPVVLGHERTCHSGTKTWVDTHIRKNHGSIPKILLIENIHYLYWRVKHKNNSIGKIYGFPENSDLDSVIRFWFDYWKEQGLKFPSGIDPLLIKTIKINLSTSAVKNLI